MLSQEEYEREYPYMAVLANKGRQAPNGGHYQAPLVQVTPGMHSYGPVVYSSGSSFAMIRNNNNKPMLPYLAGLNELSMEITPKIHDEVRQCTLRTFDPIGCNIAGVHKAMGLLHPYQ